MKGKRLIVIVSTLVVSSILLTGCFNDEKTLILSEDTTNDDLNNMVQITEEDIYLDIEDKIFIPSFSKEDKVYGNLTKLNSSGHYEYLEEYIYIQNGIMQVVSKEEYSKASMYIEEVSNNEDNSNVENDVVKGIDVVLDSVKVESNNNLLNSGARAVSYSTYNVEGQCLNGGTTGFVVGKEKVTYNFTWDVNEETILTVDFLDTKASYSIDIKNKDEFNLSDIIYFEKLDKYFLITDTKIYEMKFKDKAIKFNNEYEVDINKGLYNSENVVIKLSEGKLIDDNKAVLQLYENVEDNGRLFLGLILYDFENMKSYDIYTNPNKDSMDIYQYVVDVSNKGIVLMNNENVLTIAQIIDNQLEIVKDIKFDINKYNERCEVNAKINETGDTIIVSAITFSKDGQQVKRSSYKECKVQYRE